MKTGRTMLMAVLPGLSPGVAWAGCPSTDDVGYAKGPMYEHIECDGWWAGQANLVKIGWNDKIGSVPWNQ